MAYPTTIDSFTDPDPTDPLNSPSHSGLHTDNNTAIEALENKVGVDGSAVTTSIDYLLKNTSSSDPGHKHTFADGATDVTASAAEVNVLDGVTATTAELNYVDTTAGTAESNKALVVDANKDINMGTGDLSATDLSATNELKLTTNNKALTGNEVGGTKRELLKLNSGDNIQIGNGINKVVIKDIISASAYLGSNQTIATGTFTKLNLDTELYDAGGNFNTTTSRYVAPVSGYYSIKGAVRFVDLNAGNYPFVAIYKNGAAAAFSSMAVHANGEDPRLIVAKDIFLAATDYVELFAQHNFGTDRTASSGDAQSWITIHLIGIT